MKIRYVAMILVTAVILSAIGFSGSVNAETVSFQSLGTIDSCIVDDSRNTVIIHGSIKHSVLIGNRDSKIAVYRFDPWADVASEVLITEPEAVTDMTITFDFELPCSDLTGKLSLYAVSLIKSDGAVSLIAPPCYPDITVGDTSDAGFKTVLTENHAAALSSLPGSAIVDVYLDKLNNGNNSGYIYNADGELFYFDKEIVNELDRVIRSYSAVGAKVYLRFLISPGVTSLPFCVDSATWAINKCVVVDNADALKAIYAYTYFLISRYDGGSYGRADGIILGRGADMPVLNNYASLVSEDYSTVYARSLALIGIAAAEAAGEREVALIVPVGDLLTSAGRVNAEEFLYSVAQYLATYSNVSFTVMCESRHNPYGITDDLFASDIENESTGEATENTEPLDDTVISETEEAPETESTVAIDEETTVLSPEASEETSSDETYVIEETVSTEQSFTSDTTENDVSSSGFDEVDESPKLEPNNNSNGFFCTDSIDVFLRMFERLKKNYSSVNKGFAWCWYPSAETTESSLGICYSYNYMKLASIGADFYAVSFENENAELFPSISHLFKYIDTSSNVKETAYARTVFGVSDWSELISEYKSDVGIFTALLENELQPNIDDFSGNIVYLDYSTGTGALDWYEGVHCSSLSLISSSDEGCMQAQLDLDSAGFEQSEFGYVIKNPEPLLVGDALTFDLECGEDDGSLYEISVYINHSGGTLISKAVVLGGVNCSLSANVSKLDKTALVNSIRISVKRITGEGPCTVNLYRVTVNDYFYSDEELERKLEELRDYLRSDSENVNNVNRSTLYIGVALLAGVGCAFLFAAYGNDRKKNTNLNDDV